MYIDDIWYLQGNPCRCSQVSNTRQVVNAQLFCHESRVQENSEVHNQNSLQWNQVNMSSATRKPHSEWMADSWKGPFYQRLSAEGYKWEKSGERVLWSSWRWMKSPRMHCSNISSHQPRLHGHSGVNLTPWTTHVLKVLLQQWDSCQRWRRCHGYRSELLWHHLHEPKASVGH